MRFFLVSDNKDTMVGMRLAGIPGVVVHTKEDAEKALREAAADEEVGIVLITELLADMCPELITELKSGHEKPLLVEIPDRHGTGRSTDSITRYVREAIGIKI